MHDEEATASLGSQEWTHRPSDSSAAAGTDALAEGSGAALREHLDQRPAAFLP